MYLLRAALPTPVPLITSLCDAVTDSKRHPPLRAFSWLALLVTLLAMAICVRLGFWQLERAAEKTAYLATVEQTRQQAPAALSEVLSRPDPHLMPVTVSGYFNNDRNVLLDNRMYQQRAGYYVLTPFSTDQGQYLLVNRGWLERALERKFLPSIAPIEGHQTLTGHLYRPSQAFVLNHDIDSTENLLLVQAIDLAQLGEQLGLEFVPFEFRIDGEQALGEQQETLVRVWPQQVMGPNTHYGYAIQWFSFAAIALIVFVLASRRKPATSGEKN